MGSALIGPSKYILSDQKIALEAVEHMSKTH